MDGKPETKVNGDLGDSSNESNNSPVIVSGDEKEGAETVSSDHEEESSATEKATEEPPVGAFDSEEEGIGGNTITTEHLGVHMNEVNVSEINSSDAIGPHRLHPESPEREPTTPAEEADEEDATAFPADTDPSSKQSSQLIQELHMERDRAMEHSYQLQAKLDEYLRKKAGDDPWLGRRVQLPEQHQEYEKYINLLADLKQQLAADLETAEQRTEELRVQCHHKLDEVGRAVRLCMDRF